MANPSPLILVIAPPGRLRDSLLVLLQASCQVTIAGQADNGPAGVQWLVEHTPRIVLLDADLAQPELYRTLHLLKNEWPQIQCLVLAHTHQQEIQARADGAETVVQTGLDAETFLKALTESTRLT